MPRQTPKNWSKGEAIKVLQKINRELTMVIGGGDPEKAIKNIKAHIATLKDLTVPPATEKTMPVRKPRFPGPIKRKLQSAIRKNEEAIATLKLYKP